MDRIDSLRRVALARKHTYNEFYLRFYKKFFQADESLPFATRYSEAMTEAFSTMPPHITEGELIVGEAPMTMSREEIFEWESLEPRVREIAADSVGGQDSHMAIDYELLLSMGVDGILSLIDAYLDGAEGKKREFYLSVRSALLAVLTHSDNYSNYARTLAERETSDKRREELLRISETCARVPRYPARTFWEALQSIHFISYCLSMNPLRYFSMQQFQLGRPDRYLYPYYERDIAEGRLTTQEAQLLIDCLALQINMRVPRGLSSGYMLGGRRSDGSTVANELTMMFMRAIDDVRLVYPAVGLCYTEDMPEEYLKCACEILSHGRSHPAIFGDDTIARGLVRYGVPECEAREYVHSTCVEITPIAASNVWVASPYVNLAALLLETMDREYASFDEHLSVLLSRLGEVIRRNFATLTELRKRRMAGSMNPLLSAFVNDCLERGLDITGGGARYNWITPSFVGMANLVDSLETLRVLVYDSRELTVSSLSEILKRNFEGEEALRARILERIDKYGNDADGVDSLVSKITAYIEAECEKLRGIHSEARCIPSVFCWIKHAEFGSKTGATPDGRLAGFPLGDGSGPCQGRERKGPTASILSSTKWDHSAFIGGVAVNLKLSKSNLGVGSLSAMETLIKTYIARGGFEIQINVTDRKTLLAARENPEEYRDLVVRIGGYSDYFVALSPAMQSEVILRTEHDI